MVKHSHDPWLYRELQTTSWKTPVQDPLRLTITLWNMGDAEEDLPGKPRWPLSEVRHTVPQPSIGSLTVFITCLKDSNLFLM